MPPCETAYGQVRTLSRRPGCRPAPERQTSSARRRQHDREHHLVDGGPAEACQQLAGGERADRHGAEHQEIVERLHLVALVRAVALRSPCVVAPMKAKFQPTPEQRPARSRNAQTDDPGMPMIARGDQQERKPGGDDPLDAEAHDQRAGEEARREHAEHVPLHAERRVGRPSGRTSTIASGAEVITRFIIE